MDHSIISAAISGIKGVSSFNTFETTILGSIIGFLCCETGIIILLPSIFSFFSSSPLQDMNINFPPSLAPRLAVHIKFLGGSFIKAFI